MIPYKDIFLALNRAKVRYLVAGGVAVNLHGIDRATVDLDLIVHLELRNALKFTRVMTKLGYAPKVPVKAEEFADPVKCKSWIKDKNMIVFSFINLKEPMELIDIFVEEPVPFEELYERRTKRAAFGTFIPVVSLRDLIRMKEKAGRPKDVFDLSYLVPLGRRKK